MTAFSLSLSILITSAGQLLTHIPQPLHNSGSIRSIAIMVASLKLQIVGSYYAQQVTFSIRPGTGKDIFAGKEWIGPATIPWEWVLS
jgi:hypothetical protein